MKVINLFGAPGSGKSTTMLGLTYEMKLMGLSAENTPEFFKELILEEGQKAKFGGQLAILSEQNRRQARLDGKNDFTISDCPLPLIGYYTEARYIKGFHEMTTNLFNNYDNVNYFILRRHEFENEKRDHDEVQANRIEQELPNYLKKHGIEYKIIESVIEDENETKEEISQRLVNRILEDLIESNIITLDHLCNSRNKKVSNKYKNKI